MGKIVRCSIVLYDDFKNVLIAQRGNGRKNNPIVWGIFEKEMKGKESTEKCITKIVDKELRCNIYDLEEIKKIELDDSGENTELLFCGKLKEKIVYSKDINEIMWLSEKNLDEVEIESAAKKKIAEFFSLKR